MKSLAPYQKPGLLTRITQAVKAVMRFPASSGSWGSTFRNWFPGTTIDYANELGDLSLHSLPMSAVRWLSNTIVEAQLQVKKSTGPKGESEPVEPHELMTLLRRPNPYYAGSRLWKGFSLSWMLDGNAYFLKVRNKAGQVSELWNVPYWTIEPRWRDDSYRFSGGGSTEFISHYEYTVDGTPYPIPVEDVVHFRDGEDPRNMRKGLSPLKSILRELYNDSQLTSYGASLAGGSGVPPYIIGIDSDKYIDTEQLNDVSEMAYRKTSGTNRGRPLVLTGAKAYKLSFSPREMQLDELHDFPESRFCAAIGIPALVLDLLVAFRHGATYNNVKQAQERAYDSYLKPLQSYIADELTHQLLLPDFENNSDSHYVAYDYSKVQALQEDENEKAKRLGQLYKDGIIKRGEARSGMGYPPSMPGKEGEEADNVFAVQSTVTLTPPEGLEEEPGDDVLNNELVLPKSNGEAIEVKSVPSDDEIEKTVEWFDRTAPKEARGMLNAKVINTNGKKE